ncbi:hypothetical protein SBF1_650017 [Candidatus Desulfosporosinus infrequens]|uniref:Uncharacterized protein n=1 Tax=Candidatus Desulfosporosinus infrequens TaxID=2043169 RepID=A0A2U3LN55_9FIRM|nr:hypothetical protein SBF1_650017 [Candidatus Desulfosporosinus infrequens]
MKSGCGIVKGMSWCADGKLATKEMLIEVALLICRICRNLG